MLDQFKLDGKIALVTGGTHGLGMAIACGLSEAGARIVVNDIDKEKLEGAVKAFNEKGIDAKGYLFDVTNEAAVKEHIDLIEEEVGPIGILVNNAGIITRIPIEDLEVETFRKVIDIDLIGPFIMGKYVGKKMIERREGKIINMCSMMSEMGRPSVSAYAAAKGGLKMLTRNMAAEWGKYNIQVNGIGPGYFATAQTAPIRTEGHPFNDLIMSRTPALRWGQPEELQGAAVYLASKASNFVNGHVLYVDGGIIANFGNTSEEVAAAQNV
ncbi:gluconate 5-dehydrogenase [Prolixibacteraceae bacterium JC049]|nr:gluconate 5-dehydrogenase [Prolixibacteraceae bacterium JC049]